MKVLTILVGAPGSGKSYMISKLNLEHMTISSDNIRILVNGLYPTETKLNIPSVDDSKTWSIIMDMLENRMKNGTGIILDSTGLYNLGAIKKLREKYGYRINYIHFDNVSKEDLYENISKREINNIKKEILDNYYERSQNFTHGSDNCYKVSQYGLEGAFIKALSWYTIEHYRKEFKNYDEVFFIGDPHGEKVINDFLDLENNLENKKALYVFLGDLCDRGDENLKLLDRLMTISETNNNVLFVEGNHDRYLNNWASDNGDKLSSDFITTTKKEFDEYFADKPESELANFKKRIRVFYRTKMKPFLYFTFNNKTFFVNHGGVDKIWFDTPTVLFTGKKTYGYGSDLYGSYIDVANNFAKNHPDIIQIFGHRNIRQNELEDSYCKINETNYCVDCQLSFGNDANILVYSDQGFSYEHLENTKSIEHIIKDVDVNSKSSYLSIKKVENLYSINFTKRAFYEKIWNAITVKARGLYLYKDNTIAGRSYDKFFNYGEMQETSLDNLKKNLKFPVVAYRKYNGFLGLAFYDKEKNKLRLTSKKTLSGTYPSYIHDILNNNQKRSIEEFCKKENVTMVFEVEHIDDVHIIDKNKSRVVLLDIIHNDFVFKTMPYDTLCSFAKSIKIDVKSIEKVFNNINELKPFILDIFTNINYDFEGFVLTDSNNFSFKLKTLYYNTKKYIRTCRDNNRKMKTNSLGKVSKLQDALYKKYAPELDYEKITHQEVKDIFNKL